jgi:hypothetical protein
MAARPLPARPRSPLASPPPPAARLPPHWDQTPPFRKPATMSRSQALSWAMQAYRQLATGKAATQPRKVAVLGAAGGIGQPLSMLMKASTAAWRAPP